MTENEKLAECFRVGLKSNPPIRVTQKDYDALQAMIDIRPRPSPALVLAMERGRKLREANKL
jgi:hypothetical protein